MGSGEPFLKKAHPRNTTLIYRVIEKEDGQRPRRFEYACTDPSGIDSKECWRSHAKCESAAYHFERRFASAESGRQGVRRVRTLRCSHCIGSVFRSAFSSCGSLYSC